jgi:hypothetical protein
VIFPNFTRHETAATAERIRTTIERGGPCGKLKVTVSIGVSDSESEAATDATALISLADRAMYRAKRSAKNCVVVDDDFDGAKFGDAPDAISAAIYGETSDVQPGTRVHVLVPQPGVPRDQWEFHPEIWVIRKIDEAKRTALATPVLPPINGTTPTVEGPMAGPESLFKKANMPS